MQFRGKLQCTLWMGSPSRNWTGVNAKRWSRRKVVGLAKQVTIHLRERWIMINVGKEKRALMNGGEKELTFEHPLWPVMLSAQCMCPGAQSLFLLPCRWNGRRNKTIHERQWWNRCKGSTRFPPLLCCRKCFVKRSQENLLLWWRHIPVIHPTLDLRQHS